MVHELIVARNELLSIVFELSFIVSRTGVPELSAKMMDVPLSSTKRNTSSIGLFNSDVARHLIACLENPQ